MNVEKKILEAIELIFSRRAHAYTKKMHVCIFVKFYNIRFWNLRVMYKAIESLLVQTIIEIGRISSLMMFFEVNSVSGLPLC